MTFEQSAELNPLACPRLPWTRERLWIFVQGVAPLLFFSELAMAERWFLEGDKIILHHVMTLAVFPLIFAAIPVALTAATRCRLLNKPKIYSRLIGGRTLQILETCIRIQPANNRNRQKIRWRDILLFQLEPAGLHDERRVLTIEYGRFGNGVSRWSMIIADKSQRNALLSELHYRKQVTASQFVVRQLTTALPSHARKPKVMEIWLAVIALFFFMNGVPLLVSSLERTMHVDSGSSHGKLNPRIVAFLSKHFPDDRSRVRFFMITGGALTTVATGLYILGVAWSERERKARRAQLLREENESPKVNS